MGTLSVVHGIVHVMISVDILSRITLVIFLVIMGCLAPLWLTCVFVFLCIVGVPLFIEGVVVVMVIEALSLDFIGMGYVGWLCMLWLLLCDVYRQRLSLWG